MQVVVNPLSFIEAEDPTKDAEGKAQIPTAEVVLRYLCEHVNCEPANLVRRYRDLTNQSPQIAVIPAQHEIVEKILVPLHSAIASYMTGNYYGTIALCGLVCEMLAIFIFEIHDIRARNEPLDSARQKRLLGRTFEQLGQERRVDVLHAFGVINDEHRSRFNEVRSIRNAHLHLLSHDAESLPKDAKRCFQCAVELLEVVFRTEIKDGKLMLRSQILKYLKSKGFGSPSAA